jgi:hypothetical protein
MDGLQISGFVMFGMVSRMYMVETWRLHTWLLKSGPVVLFLVQEFWLSQMWGIIVGKRRRLSREQMTNTLNKSISGNRRRLSRDSLCSQLVPAFEICIIWLAWFSFCVIWLLQFIM